MATLLDLVLKASLLMIVAGVSVVLMRRASAASRHVALIAALGAVVLLPAAKWAIPALPLFVLAAESQPAPVPPPPTEAFATVAAPIVIAEPRTVGQVDRPVPSVPSSEFVRASSPSWSWPGVLGILWFLGAGVVLVRMTVAGVRIRRLTRDAQPIDDVRVTERLLEIKKQFGVTRPITLVVSEHEWMPLTWGLVRPTILLPSSATTWIETRPVRLDAVLLHEMAHIARWDAAWQRVAGVAVAFFWFNPLVWIAARRARLEREHACDDAVVAQGLRATDYASDLVVIAQTMVLPSRAGDSALAMARRSQLEQRVGALLDGQVSHRRASRVSQLLAMALIALMLPMSAATLAARPVAAPESSVVANGARGLQTPGYGGDDVSARELEPQSLAPRPAPGASAVSDEPPSISVEPATEAQQASTPPLDQPVKWALERDAMFRLLIERARNYVRDSRIKTEIGTASALDPKWLEDTLALVERWAVASKGSRHCVTPDPFATLGGGTCVNGGWTSTPPSPQTYIRTRDFPTDAEIADVKTKFNDAMRKLDAAEVRWDNGLLSNQELSAAVTAALKVLTEGPPAPFETSFVARSGTNTVAATHDHFFTAANFPNSTPEERASARALYELLTGRVAAFSAPPSDADLIDMLKGAASVKDEVKRAGALLELSARYAFTPEMVTLYVNAAKGMTSAAEQARVFAQPIRVK